MGIRDRLREYLRLLMIQTFGYHYELNELALTFVLNPLSDGTIKTRCRSFAKEIPDGRFHELAEYVLNWRPNYNTYDSGRLHKQREGFARALRIYGFKVDHSRRTWSVEPRFGPSRLEEQKKEVKTLLEQYGFNEVQTDLTSAEEHYINGDFSQSLMMGRKALEDLFSSMGKKIGVDRSTFLSSIGSKSARDLIKSIYGYGCKGHELTIPEYEAIFGYHLIVSSIYFILILFKNQ